MNTLDEKTLAPNEVAKKEEIVKSLKKKQSDFVKRYGADRAKGVMYATATKVAKAVTEEAVGESFSIHGSGANFDSVGFDAHMQKLIRNKDSHAAQEVAKMIAQKDYDDRVKKTSAERAAKEAAKKLITDPMHYSHSTNIKTEEAEELDEAEAQKFMSNAMDNIPSEKRDAARATYKKARSIGMTHAAALNTMTARHMKNEELDVLKTLQREHLLETGELLTLNQIRESDSAIDGSVKGPISRASAKHGRIKPMSGTKTIATKIATILAKKV